ncbi:MAG TPA: hypothetical protein PLM49_06090 [Bacteroidales bacterium]|nr:hypothetical protein [Bacteroidales bacterium]
MHLLQPNNTYHIFNHANGFENLFQSDENKRFFMERYVKHIVPIADTYAYCLMNNHFHLLLKIKGGEEIEKIRNQQQPSSSKVSNFGRAVVVEVEVEYFISKQFANFFSSYTQAFNKMYGRMGSLFIKNFKREEIKNEDHFRALVVYIHRNPVHHGFCKHFSEWKFSSYNSLNQADEGDLIDRAAVFEAFGNEEACWDVHNEKLAKYLFSTQLDL